jgi:hypothetical protein
MTHQREVGKVSERNITWKLQVRMLFNDTNLPVADTEHQDLTVNVVTRIVGKPELAKILEP